MNAKLIIYKFIGEGKKKKIAKFPIVMNRMKWVNFQNSFMYASDILNFTFLREGDDRLHDIKVRYPVVVAFESCLSRFS